MNNKLKFGIVLALCVLALTNSVFAKIVRLNNNTGVTGTGVYATYTLALPNTSAGDTLIIEGSNTTYGDFAIAKKLTIFGPGYHLNVNPNTQASLLSANLGTITFNTGSDGSLISGCKINDIQINENNITIARNFIKNATGANASILLNGSNSNIIIQQNIVWGLITNTAAKTPGVVIRNNLVGRILFTGSVTYALIMNNTFEYEYCYYNGGGNIIDVSNATITNNIVYSYSSYNLKFDASNTITYNILNQADPALGIGSNNVFGVAMTNVFSGLGTGDLDKSYIIKAGGPAETGGQGGIECGMFGGPNKYILSGLPPIPHIYSLDSDPAGTNSAPLNVKISVKSQN